MKRSIEGSTVMLALVISSAAAADDKADVMAAMNAWKDSLAAACSGGGPAKILPLYAQDGVLWGTISSTIRDDRAELEDYFVTACSKLPKLTVEFKDPLVRIYGGDTAINSGVYTFTYEKDGQTTQLPARYSFTLVKRDGQWLIADHHSSAMPK
jgi:uncharacterized protein (TIGR02246 family)